jgi:hypothetical protein
VAKRRAAARGATKKVLKRAYKITKGAKDAFNGSADWVAKRTGKPKVTRTASAEWTNKAHGNGERIPPPVLFQGVRWGSKFEEKDKQRWFVNLSGVTFELILWPTDNLDKIERLARERAGELYGVYSQAWVLHELRLLGTLGDLAMKDEEVTA